jgi:hypothetical protein
MIRKPDVLLAAIIFLPDRSKLIICGVAICGVDNEVDGVVKRCAICTVVPS